jgi:hypothetical protein
VVTGIHDFNGGPYSENMFRSRKLSWLRENQTFQPWKTWHVPIASRTRQQVVYRDAIILDGNGEFFAVQNLSDESLSSGGNRIKFANTLLSAATITDTDIDGLPDRWEFDHFGSIEANAETAVAGGTSALIAYAFSQDPMRYTPSQAPVVSLARQGDLHFLQLRYRRRLGGEGERIQYTPELSTDGIRWTAEPSDWEEVGRENPWDGSGTEVVTLRLLRSIEGTNTILARLRVESPL